MAYRCKNDMMKECDGCGCCSPRSRPETGVTITATIELKFTAYGLIEEELRNGKATVAQGIAEELMQYILWNAE